MLLDAPVVAVVGVAKNCGKTTTLNLLAGEAAADSHVVGLVSAGIDGESKDALLGTPKPPIHARRGMLVATTREMVRASTAELEFLDVLGFDTPLGEAVVARVLSDGDVLLGGMRHRSDISDAVRSMQQLGADRVFIDGAYGRVVAAQPGVSDAVVVATGAVVAQRIGTIVEKTATLIDRLTVPRAELEWQRALMQRAIAEDRTLLGGSALAEPIELPAKSALLGLSRGREAWTPEVEAVAVPGLVSDRVAQELLRRRRAGALLLADGTSFQVDEKISRKLRRKWQVFALQTCEVVAISYNPTSLRGWVVDDEALQHALKARFPNTAVFNPLLGLQ